MAFLENIDEQDERLSGLRNDSAKSKSRVAYKARPRYKICTVKKPSLWKARNNFDGSIKQQNNYLIRQIDLLNQSIVLAQLEIDSKKGILKNFSRIKKLLENSQNEADKTEISYLERHIEKISNSLAIAEMEKKAKNRMLENVRKIKEELHRKRRINKELSVKLKILQLEYDSLWKSSLKMKEEYEEMLATEKHFRINAELRCKAKQDEIRAKNNKIQEMEHAISFKTKKIEEVQKYTKKQEDSQKVKMKILTKTLFSKQNSLEKVTKQRNQLQQKVDELDNTCRNHLARIKELQTDLVRIQMFDGVSKIVTSNDNLKEKCGTEISLESEKKMCKKGSKPKNNHPFLRCFAVLYVMFLHVFIPLMIYVFLSRI